MTDSDCRYFKRSPIIVRFFENLTLHYQQNFWGDQVYLARNQTRLYAGYVGLIHVGSLRQTLKQ